MSEYFVFWVPSSRNRVLGILETGLVSTQGQASVLGIKYSNLRTSSRNPRTEHSFFVHTIGKLWNRVFDSWNLLTGFWNRLSGSETRFLEQVLDIADIRIFGYPVSIFIQALIQALIEIYLFLTLCNNVRCHKRNSPII